jgi:chromosome segregation ATPase
LENANKIVQLAKTNYHNYQEVTEAVKRDLLGAQEVFERATAALKTASNKFINAQTESAQAAQNAAATLTSNLNARNVYNLAFNAYSAAKKQLQDTLNQKQQADTVVAAAQNAVNVVNQLNDNAQSGLTAAQNVYVKAYSALNNANTLVSQIQESLNDAADQLGVSKFNLQQANNNLFVAQARKEQADKATEIVRVQSSALPADDSTSTYIFAGCEQQAYPSIGGSAQINDSNKYGYQLSSGHTLVFGGCTKADNSVRKGDLITYYGYIKNGYVHCTSYSKAH